MPQMIPHKDVQYITQAQTSSEDGQILDHEDGNLRRDILLLLILFPYLWVLYMYASLVPRLPDLFNVHEKEGEPGIQCHVREVGQNTTVGRVTDREMGEPYFQALQIDVNGRYGAKAFKSIVSTGIGTQELRNLHLDWLQHIHPSV